MGIKGLATLTEKRHYESHVAEMISCKCLLKPIWRQFVSERHTDTSVGHKDIETVFKLLERFGRFLCAL